jgi:dTDP-glucose pyrophosphorylase
MGSRYGSLKQMDGIGPSGEAIIDYSIYDAIRAGFTKVVFVIRHSFEKDFREVFSPARFGGRIKVEYVFQELENLPEGYTVPEGREKPWGTNHAIMMAAKNIHEPFAVINADDFYGSRSYKVIADYLQTLHGSTNRYAMVGYLVANTLSENGGVSRGVCRADEGGNLADINERHGVERLADGRVVYADADGTQHPLTDDTLVSMNMFGFTPDYFKHTEDSFCEFLDNTGGNLKAEYYISVVVDNLIKTGVVQMRVLPTPEVWFGVTYKADRPMVEERLRSLVAAGEYPENLWAKK